MQHYNKVIIKREGFIIYNSSWSEDCIHKIDHTEEKVDMRTIINYLDA